MVPSEEMDNESFYLPIQEVVSLSSTASKVRLVFDGSAKSTTMMRKHCRCKSHCANFNQISNQISNGMCWSTQQLQRWQLCLGSRHEEALQLQKSLCQLLHEAGIICRKWWCSVKGVSNIPANLQEIDSNRGCKLLKALGTHWDTAKDNLFVTTPSEATDTLVTKKKSGSSCSRDMATMSWTWQLRGGSEAKYYYKKYGPKEKIGTRKLPHNCCNHGINGQKNCHSSTKWQYRDLLSRGVSASTLKNSLLWWHGPTWLSLSRQHWSATLVSNKNQLWHFTRTQKSSSNNVEISCEWKFPIMDSILQLQ